MGWCLVYGGGRAGLMGVVPDAASAQQELLQVNGDVDTLSGAIADLALRATAPDDYRNI